MTCIIAQENYQAIDLSLLNLANPSLERDVHDYLKSFDVYNSHLCRGTAGDLFLDETEARCLGGQGDYSRFEQDFNRAFPNLWLDFVTGQVRYKSDRSNLSNQISQSLSQDLSPPTSTIVDNKNPTQKKIRPSAEYMHRICETHRRAESNGQDAHQAFSDLISEDQETLQQIRQLPMSELWYTAASFFITLPPLVGSTEELIYDNSQCMN